MVHGGGKRASELLKALQISPRMHEGRRITDEPTLEVVTMVYAGSINKRIVSLLQALGCNAIGLSGADGNVILAHKRIVQTIDYGFAGDIDQINTPVITSLLNAGLTPVCCAITHDGKGQLLNTNADTIASSLAKALSQEYQVSLKFCFEKKGVLADPEDDHSVISELNPDSYGKYRSEGIITDGMIPKLDNAFAALQAGVSEVIIGSPVSLFSKESTRIHL